MSGSQVSGAPVLLALRRVGPYHHARFQAAARRLPLVVLETRPHSQEYPWAFTPSEPAYGLERLGGAGDPERDPPLAALDRQLKELLERLRPAALVCVGWGDPPYQRLLRASLRRRLPWLLIADSRERDHRRHPLTELPKRLLLRQCAAALVAGSESRAYLEGLGLDPAAIFQPWDVVDNALFARGPAAGSEGMGTTAPLPTPHLLCVSRFVAKKNHAGLLEAYGRYQAQGGAWGLRLVGCGPLEAEIRARAAALPDPGRVRIEPFQQIETLVRTYHQAAAFVLASSTDQWGLVVNEAMAAGLPVLVSDACGCAADLVEHGHTGWRFDPADPEALLAGLWRLECQSEPQRRAMARAAAERLRQFDPEAFAGGLAAALERARARPRQSRLAGLTASLLARR